MPVVRRSIARPVSVSGSTAHLPQISCPSKRALEVDRLSRWCPGKFEIRPVQSTTAAIDDFSELFHQLEDQSPTLTPSPPATGTVQKLGMGVGVSPRPRQRLSCHRDATQQTSAASGCVTWNSVNISRGWCSIKTHYIRTDSTLEVVLSGTISASCLATSEGNIRKARFSLPILHHPAPAR